MSTTKLPHWDMTPLFPALDSPEFDTGVQEAVQKVADLAELFDQENINADGATPAVDAALITRFETVTRAYNEALDTIKVVRAYISSFIATDSRNQLAQTKGSELRQTGVTLGLLSTRYTAWAGALDVEGLIAASPFASEHAYYIREAKEVASHLLTPGEEELAADLNLAAGSAWARLYSDVTSQISVPFAKDGATSAPEMLPISLIRALASDDDRSVRQRAYDAELKAWEVNAIPLAAAMNAIKHESNVHAKRRGWGTPLDSAVFGSHIDRATLDAMLSAARKSFPDFRRYLQAKAKLVSGADALPWWDLFAPVGESADVWEWDKATVFVAEKFGVYSSKMQQFAERTFLENWIDAEPRPGKRDGAFCMGIRADESRIMQNYKPAFGGVSTLAHELGHAYHNLCLAERTPLQRGTPMTLAETASIFCETIIRDAALSEAGSYVERLTILEASLQGTCQVVVDITSRFLFEQRVLEARQKRELSVAELCDIMRGAQLETYGDGLDADFLHPYMWAAKGHYYGSTFYNYPYMFGLLFGLGLYAQYKRDPEPFRARYDELLSLTGMATANELGERFGFNIREEDFWTASLDLAREDIDLFVKLAGV